MSTFERARDGVLRDMAADMTHTSESWAAILLRNTSRLTDVKEQEKFWGFLVNPEDDEDLPAPIIEPYEATTEVREEFTTVPLKEENEEKARDVELQNQYYRNGMTCYVRTRTDLEMLEPLSHRLAALTLETDEKTDS